MLNWKHTKGGKTALLIKGARRVGKSTIAEEFAKREYDSYIVVDFANAPEGVWEAVKNIADLNNFFFQLQFIYPQRRDATDDVSDGLRGVPLGFGRRGDGSAAEGGF